MISTKNFKAKRIIGNTEEDKKVEEANDVVILSQSESESDPSDDVPSRSLAYEQADTYSVIVEESGKLEREDSDSDAEEFQRNPKPSAKKAFYVPVYRNELIQQQRLQLPILAEEQQIVEKITNNPVVVICGETGSGKTTQVPQFLYEAGYGSVDSDNPGMIGVTQPRRVAAVSIAKRVAEELNLPKDVVSYHVRFDASTSSKTKIKFMTDGILLKEMSTDFLLKQYSVIVIDEAHERNINSDILLGMLSRVVKLRLELSAQNEKMKPLKLVIMSATLRVKDFVDNFHLFANPPPVINITARQFPVTVHFNRETVDDYVSEAYKKICQIHSNLPAGGILVFLSGQSEIQALCNKLSERFPFPVLEGMPKTSSKIGTSRSVTLPREDIVIDIDATAELSEKLDCGFEGEIKEDFDLEAETKQPLHVLPLYSLLSSSDQHRIFESPPGNARLCVVATNIAETSLTIPDIKYVVDSGKVKERIFDPATGIQKFVIGWTSKASAEQRSGRAGRVGPGHCYRLFSSAVFENQFAEFSEPEILRIPLEGVILSMKSMGIDNVINFPFPSPPKREGLKSAEDLLVTLGALKREDKCATELGKKMSMFPISPRFSKMLLHAKGSRVLGHVVNLVASLSVPGLMIEDAGKKAREASSSVCDFVRMLNCLALASANSFRNCEEYSLRAKSVVEVNMLRKQILGILNSLDCVNVNAAFSVLKSEEVLELRQIVLVGYLDSVALLNETSYSLMHSDEASFIHPGSDVFASLPRFVVYNEVCNQGEKNYLKGVTAIEAGWLQNSPLCNYGQPLESPLPRYDASSDTVLCTCSTTYGPKGWSIPATEIEYPVCHDKYKWFARFLLEGQVIESFKEYADQLTTKPSTIVKNWTLAKITEVVYPLIQLKISNRQGLIEKWRVSPLFLLSGYLMWLPQEVHSKVKSNWPFK